MIIFCTFTGKVRFKLIYEGRTTWEGARDRCHRFGDGWELPTAASSAGLSSREIVDNILKNISNSKAFYLGATRDNQQANWTWTDGSPWIEEDARWEREQNDVCPCGALVTSTRVWQDISKDCCESCDSCDVVTVCQKGNEVYCKGRDTICTNYKSAYKICTLTEQNP